MILNLALVALAAFVLPMLATEVQRAFAQHCYLDFRQSDKSAPLGVDALNSASTH